MGELAVREIFYPVKLNQVDARMLAIWKENKDEMDHYCHNGFYQNAATYVVLTFVGVSMLYYTLELVKNLTVRTEFSTLHSISECQFFADYPLINFKVQDLRTLQYAYSAYSYCMLLISLVTEDHISQMQCIEVDAIMLVLKVFISFSRLLCGASNGGKAILVEGIHLLIIAMVWSAMLCHTYTSISKTNFKY